MTEQTVVERLIEPLAEALVSTDPELLQCDSVDLLPHDPVGDLVVNVGHEAFFSFAYFPQLAFVRTSAFGLELGSQMAIAVLDRSDARGLKELIVGEHGVIDDAGVHTEYSARRSNSRRSLLEVDAEHETIAIEGQLGGDGILGEVLMEAFRNDDRKLHATAHTGESDETCDEIWSEGSLIVPDGRPSSLDRQPLQLLPLEHLRGVVSRGRHHGRGNTRIALTNRIVGQMVQTQFVDHVSCVTDHQDVIGSGVDRLDYVDKPLICGKMQGDGTLHQASLAWQYNSSPITCMIEN